MSGNPSSIVLVFLLLGAILLVGCIKFDTTSDTKENTVEKPIVDSPGQPLLILYDNSQYGIEMGYPDGWTKKDSDKAVVFFMAPPNGITDNYKANLNLIIQDLSQDPRTLDEYTLESINAIKAGYQGSQQIESKSTVLSGNPAHKSVFTIPTDKGFTIRIVQVWMIKDNKAYLLSFSSEESVYPLLENDVNAMINSFRIK